MDPAGADVIRAQAWGGTPGSRHSAYGDYSLPTGDIFQRNDAYLRGVGGELRAAKRS